MSWWLLAASATRTSCGLAGSLDLPGRLLAFLVKLGYVLWVEEGGECGRPSTQLEGVGKAPHLGHQRSYFQG